MSMMSEMFNPAARCARSVPSMNVQFISGFAVITPDVDASRKLYVEALGLPLTASDGDEYLHSEQVDGAKHFGVWPLWQAAEACFGTREWPAVAPVRRRASSPTSRAATPLRPPPRNSSGPALTSSTRASGAVGPDRRQGDLERGPRRRRLVRALDAPVSPHAERQAETERTCALPIGGSFERRYAPRASWEPERGACPIVPPTVVVSACR